jgi:hypothetical protein
MLVLAMGGYTPFFYWLYNYVPGFNVFRGMDKFLWLAALFLSALAGMGMDQMLRGRAVPRWLAAGAAGLGVALCLLAALPGHLDWWARVVKCIPASGADTLMFSGFGDPGFIAISSRNAVHCLLRGGLTLFVAASLLELARSRRNLACLGMALMAAVELASFAMTSLMTFQILPPYSPAVRTLLAQHPGDYRILHFNPNGAMTTGALDVEGDDPSALLRYRRFLAFAEGYDFDTAPYGMPAQKFDTNALRMLRCRYLISYDERIYSEFAGGLPQLLLVDRFRLMTNYHGIFSTLTNADFKMDQEVILESPPDPLPQPAREKGTVRLLESSTDYLQDRSGGGRARAVADHRRLRPRLAGAGAAGQRAGPLRGDAGQLLFAGDPAGGGPSFVASRVFAVGLSPWESGFHRRMGRVFCAGGAVGEKTLDTHE